MNAMIEFVDTGVVHMSDIKTFDEVAKMSGIEPNESHKIDKLRILIRKLKRERRLIEGVDYIRTKIKAEKYTPVGIEKIMKEYGGD